MGKNAVCAYTLIFTGCWLVFMSPATASAACPEERESCAGETNGAPRALNVTILPVHGANYTHPGHTAIIVGTTPYAHVTIKVTYAHSLSPTQTSFTERLEAESEEWGENETDGATLEWSCSAPMLMAHYEVRAQGVANNVIESGPGLLKSGSFVERLTRRWCKRAKAQEAHERWERRQSHLACGSIVAKGEHFAVTVSHGGATCPEARGALRSFMNGGGEEHGGVESPSYLKTWSLPGGWECGYGAGGGGCGRGGTQILAVWHR
jgi:hypothetical protein